MSASRGTPFNHITRLTVDHWQCRFVAKNGEGNAVDKNQIVALLQGFADANLDAIKTKNLYNFKGNKGYSA